MVDRQATPLVIQIVGFKNSGKTTLIERLISSLTGFGFQIGTIKHDAHNQFDIDHPGTDTWRHRKAGAHVTAITSAHHTAVMTGNSSSLQDLLQMMTTMDLVFVEGFKHEQHSKIVILKDKEDEKLIRQLDHVIAVAAWADEMEFDEPDIEVPVFSVNDIDNISTWIMKELCSLR